MRITWQVCANVIPLPGQIVEETDDEYDDGVTSSSDVVEILGRRERSTDARKTINGHQHHHPDGNRLHSTNMYYDKEA